jgi:hypothetical protein
MHGVDSAYSFDHPVGHRRQGWRNFDRERQLSHEGRDEKSASACFEQLYSEGLLSPRGERPNDSHAAEKRS